MAKTVAALLVDVLAEAGVKRIYGSPATRSTELQIRFAFDRTLAGLV
jgi:2-succinyl-5-enolpyruvyl-6-hydroxy-3-cyclohexene-1-carboxylate synthase